MYIPIWVWALLGVAVYYLGAISLIYRTQRYSDDVDLVDVDDSTLPRSVAKQFSQYRATLRELGFESLGEFVLPKLSPRLTTFIEVYADRLSCDLATVTRMFATVEGVEGHVAMDIQYVEFLRRLKYADFALINTNNIGTPPPFPRETGTFTAQLPMISDPRELLAIHRKLVVRLAPGAKPYLRVDDEFRGDVRAFIAHACIREVYERWRDCGWMFHDAQEHCWRPTLWGACRLTWQQLFPFKQYKANRLHRTARKLVAELRSETMGAAADEA